jgi:hypothetical protein
MVNNGYANTPQCSLYVCCLSSYTRTSQTKMMYFSYFFRLLNATLRSWSNLSLHVFVTRMLEFAIMLVSHFTMLWRLQGVLSCHISLTSLIHSVNWLQIPISTWKMVQNYWTDSWRLVCMITLCNFVVPMCTVWYVILFRETGVVHQIAHSFNYFFFYLFYLVNLLLIK